MAPEIYDGDKTKYGVLGLDVGNVGRWIRLCVGILYLIPIVLSLLFDPETLSIFYQTIKISSNVLFFYLALFINFFIIVFLYIIVYREFGEKIFSKNNGWLNTVIFVGPPLLVGYWNIFFLHFIPIKMPLPLVGATALYISISLILEWRIKYGGCEVVSIPIILFKKRYKTYCIPIVAIDAIEKTIVDRKNNKK